MIDIRVADLRIGDVVMDPSTDRNPNRDGTSCRVRVQAWRKPEDPSDIAFTYQVIGTRLDGQLDWASYSPDERLTLIEPARA